MTVSEKAKKLSELAKELEQTNSSKEDKLISSLCELMCELCRDVEDLETNTASLAVAISELGSDIAYLEDMCIESGEPEYDSSELVCGGDCSSCSGCFDAASEEEKE